MTPESWGPPEAVRAWAQSKVTEAFIRDLRAHQANLLNQLLTACRNSTEIAEVRGKHARYSELEALLELLYQARSTSDGERGERSITG